MRASVLYLLVPASLATYGGFLYYRLAWLHHQSRMALRHMDEQMGKHHELLPHLLLAVAKYAENEREVLLHVIRARKHAISASTQEERMAASSHLSRALLHLFRVSESCTLLHMDDEAALIHSQVMLAEQKIAVAREYYNQIIEHYNERVSRFPSCIVARLCRFERKMAFERPELLGALFPSLEY